MPTHQTHSPEAPTRLYVLGGRQRKPTLNMSQEWNHYEAAVILEIDLGSGSAHVVAEYKSPPAALPADHASILFKAGTIVGNKMYCCTSTEVLIFDVPKFTLSGYISLPCFNDLHHVAPDAAGNLLVASTGLDMVVQVDPSGAVLNQWNVLGEDPWKRFSREIDYRKIASTKPHRAHPNFCFEFDSHIWVTRFEQRDAICLSNPARKIHIGIESPHDGHVYGRNVHFTTVDGHVVIANGESLQTERVIDLASINGKEAVLGWCRGLLSAGPDKFWVGFTRIRRTKFQENLFWLNHTLRNRALWRPTHIGLYDISREACLREIELEPYGVNVVFSILPAP